MFTTATMESKVAPRNPGDPIRVLMVIQQFSPIVGGAERQALQLARALRRRGTDVLVLTARWSISLRDTETVDGVPVIRLGIARLGSETRRLGGGLSFMVQIVRYLFAHARTYDVVHVHQALKPAVAAAAACRLLAKPMLIKIGCGGGWSDLNVLGSARVGPFHIGRLYLSVMRNVPRFVALNTDIVEELRSKGFREEQILPIPNGIDLSRRPRARKGDPDQAVRLLFVGRLDHQKGLDLLLHAVKRLPSSVAWRLDVVGSGSEERVLRRMTDELGISASVKFRGAVGNVPELLLRTDLFILPSRAEGMSNALLEAMSAGVACIATAIGGNRDLIEDGRNGLLVRPENPTELAAAIRRLATSPAERRRLGSAAQRRIRKRYSIDSVAREYEKAYASLLGQQP